MPLDPNADRWDLPVRGFAIGDVWFSGAPHLVEALYVIARDTSGTWTPRDFPTEPPQTKIRLEGTFVVTLSDGIEHHLDATHPWETLVPVLRLRGARIASATADRRGNLRVDFEDGSRLVAGPDDRRDNWGLSGPDALILEAPPGGGDPRIAH